ncbi:hypothetical protein [Nostoc sp. UHCC 0251]|nr:hypothetical protein [Nostoc sp. UHCC 0251]MEA5623951.1 hypothetical protein [Nostoc sp. UHCC 0251]
MVNQTYTDDVLVSVEEPEELRLLSKRRDGSQNYYGEIVLRLS